MKLNRVLCLSLAGCLALTGCASTSKTVSEFAGVESNVAGNTSTGSISGKNEAIELYKAHEPEKAEHLAAYDVSNSFNLADYATTTFERYPVYTAEYVDTEDGIFEIVGTPTEEDVNHLVKLASTRDGYCYVYNPTDFYYSYDDNGSSISPHEVSCVPNTVEFSFDNFSTRLDGYYNTECTGVITSVEPVTTSSGTTDYDIIYTVDTDFEISEEAPVFASAYWVSEDSCLGTAVLDEYVSCSKDIRATLKLDCATEAPTVGTQLLVILNPWANYYKPTGTVSSDVEMFKLDDGSFLVHNASDTVQAIYYRRTDEPLGYDASDVDYIYPHAWEIRYFGGSNVQDEVKEFYVNGAPDYLNSECYDKFVREIPYACYFNHGGYLSLDYDCSATFLVYETLSGNIKITTDTHSIREKGSDLSRVLAIYGYVPKDEVAYDNSSIRRGKDE